MSNFVNTFLNGKIGSNFGLPTGLTSLDKAINGLQRKTTIGLAAAPKCGKTSLSDYCFVISPYLYMLANNKLNDIEWIYFSYEIDRVNKEFKFAAFFMAHDYQVYNVTYKGKIYSMCQDYLMGRMIHDNGDGTTEMIPIQPDHEDILKKIYLGRIIPLFGEYNEHGIMTRKGKIDFIEEPENPTGIDKYLKNYARRNGRFIEQSYDTHDDQGRDIIKKRIVGYVANNPNKYTIIITDHIRKLRKERGFTTKENIDKHLEYSTYLRNLCGFTYIHIIHSNRGLSNTDRLKYAGEYIFPTADDCKDSGNPAEECTIFMTLFNANDERYNLKKHFGKELVNYPNYRSLHITESRYTECPVHIQINMFGGINMFQPL